MKSKREILTPSQCHYFSIHNNAMHHYENIENRKHLPF